MPTPFAIELVTPERVLFSGQAEQVSLRTEEGEIAFLAHHEDFIGALDITVVSLEQPTGATVDTERAELTAAVHGGFVHVKDDGVTILARVAELSSEIDIERARRAFDAASARLSSEGPTDLESVEGLEHGGQVRPSNALLGLLVPDAPEAALARARTRLSAVGATPNS